MSKLSLCSARTADSEVVVVEDGVLHAHVSHRAGHGRDLRLAVNALVGIEWALAREQILAKETTTTVSAVLRASNTTDPNMGTQLATRVDLFYFVAWTVTVTCMAVQVVFRVSVRKSPHPLMLRCDSGHVQSPFGLFVVHVVRVTPA